MSINESSTVSKVLPPYFSLSYNKFHLRTSRSVSVGGSDGGTNSGTSASRSYPVFPLSLKVMNEYCMKILMPTSSWK